MASKYKHKRFIKNGVECIKCPECGVTIPVGNRLYKCAKCHAKYMKKYAERKKLLNKNNKRINHMLQTPEMIEKELAGTAVISRKALYETCTEKQIKALEQGDFKTLMRLYHGC